MPVKCSLSLNLKLRNTNFFVFLRDLMSHLLLISNQPKAMEKNIFLDFDYAYFSRMERDFSYFITYIDLRSLRPRKPLPSISLILFPWRNLLKVTERMIDKEHNKLSSTQNHADSNFLDYREPLIFNWERS